ncbi:MAG: sensor domain-containing diguanylate cyclase [Elusimicrobiota bacterium]
MIIVISLFLFAISFIEILGPIIPLHHYISLSIAFLFLIYQYHKIKRLSREKTLIKQRLTKTNEVIQALITTTNISKLLPLVIDILSAEKYFDSAFIYLIEKDNTLTCIATKNVLSLGGIKKYSFIPEDQNRIIVQTIKSMLPVVVSGTELNYLVDREIVGKLQLKQCVLLPLVIQNKILGIIIVGNSGVKIDITSQHLKALTTVSNQVAVALQNAQLYSKIQELSTIDELTHLYNYRFFQQEIREELELAKRYNSYMSLAIIDIDFFKNYNDTNGHLAGDICLKQIAQVILQSIRKTDIAARYGGEEFAIILPATDKHGATKILEKLRYDVERYPFEYRCNQPDGRLSISAGISTSPNDTKEPRKLLELADQALYEAKKLGRNKVIVYENNKIQQEMKN